MSWISWDEAAARAGVPVLEFARSVARTSWTVSWSIFSPQDRAFKQATPYSCWTQDTVRAVVVRVVSFDGDTSLEAVARRERDSGVWRGADGWAGSLLDSTHLWDEDVNRLAAMLAAELVEDGARAR